MQAIKQTLVAFVAAASVSAQIFNPNFDLPVMPNTVPINLSAGSDFIPGWEIPAGRVQLRYGEENVSQGINLNGGDVFDPNSGPGQLRQSGIMTEPGARYRLTYMVEPKTSDSREIRADFYWNGLRYDRLEYTITGQRPEGGHLEIRSYIVEGTGSDTIWFISRNPGWAGVFLDNFRLEAVSADTPLTPIPEPGSFALVVGTALLAFAWRRSRASNTRLSNL